ncbi:hypothetical protein OE88DRAFT_1640044, partial [Heliocybe sulcata]
MSTQPSPVAGDSAAEREAQIAEWLEKDGRARGNIRLHCSPSVAVLIKDKTTAKDTWDTLKAMYSAMSVAAIYNELKAALGLKIPVNEHPAADFAKLNQHFDKLSEAKQGIPSLLQVLIALHAAPPCYDSVLQVTLQSHTEMTLDVAAVRSTITLAWEQSQGKKMSGAPTASKISAVKRK